MLDAIVIKAKFALWQLLPATTHAREAEKALALAKGKATNSKECDELKSQSTTSRRPVSMRKAISNDCLLVRTRTLGAHRQPLFASGVSDRPSLCRRDGRRRRDRSASAALRGRNRLPARLNARPETSPLWRNDDFRAGFTSFSCGDRALAAISHTITIALFQHSLRGYLRATD